MSHLQSPAPLRRFLRHGTLPQLAALEAVVRLGSVTQAAHTLCLAQSTVSGHLHKLAEALGVCLFTARGKRLLPTAAGLAVLQSSQDIFTTLQRCEQTLAILRADAGRPH